MNGIVRDALVGRAVSMFLQVLNIGLGGVKHCKAATGETRVPRVR
jgi:hypothetical protein